MERLRGEGGLVGGVLGMNGDGGDQGACHIVEGSGRGRGGGWRKGSKNMSGSGRE